MKGYKNMNTKLVRYEKPLFPSLFSREEFLTPFSTLFDDFFNESFPSLDVGFLSKSAYPRIDISETDISLELTAEVPGLTKEQVSIELNDGILSIKGEKKQEEEKKDKKYVHRELKHSSFCRSFVVGENVDKNAIDAKFENGILTVNLPKVTPTPKAEPKKIEIK